MPESPHPRVPGHPPDSTAPIDLAIPRGGFRWPPDPIPTLEHDREVLSWLQCSTQLSSDVTG